VLLAYEASFLTAENAEVAEKGPGNLCELRELRGEFSSPILNRGTI